jgi:hypothetical protein
MTDVATMNPKRRPSPANGGRRAAHAAIPLLLILLLPGMAAAQLPSTDIYVVPLSRDATGGVALGQPVNVTVRPGYDNQPTWLADGSGLLYTSIRDDAQADIYRYDLISRSISRVTATPESEYSPTPMPDGRHFSVVRVEADSTQRLWRFPFDGAGAPSLLLPDVKPVGYHSWADDTTLALFVLGSPATMQLARTTGGSPEVRARRIGRALTRIPGERAFAYVQMDSGGQSGTIRRVWLDGMIDEELAPLAGGNEYHTWLPDGTLLSAAGTSVYQWDPNRRSWLEVADLDGMGLREISRMSVNPAGDRLALVAIPAGIEVRKDR